MTADRLVGRGAARAFALARLGVDQLLRSFFWSAFDRRQRGERRRVLRPPWGQVFTALPPAVRVRLARWLLAERHEWQSFDPHPWRHPWLTAENLRATREFSEQIWAEAHEVSRGVDPCRLRFGFVGNLANNLYVRRAALRRLGLHITQFLHPDERYAMSHPAWEEFEGSLTEQDISLSALRAAWGEAPWPEDVVQLPQDREVAERVQRLCQAPSAEASAMRSTLPPVDMLTLLRCLPFFAAEATHRRLRGQDALVACQSLPLALFAGPPYLAVQNGGDLWFEASRNDRLGVLQRRGYARATAILATNPWTFAHARRFGLTNAIYLPMILDEDRYAPGPPTERRSWEESSGGDFFVLVTSRLDVGIKGSDRALAGFCRWARQRPGARLVVISWGRDRERLLDRFHAAGLADRVIPVPPSGKRRLIQIYRSADCVIDQLHLGYYGATGIEAMACGKPVIMHLHSAQYAALLPAGAPPIRPAASEEEVAEQLAVLGREPESLANAGAAGRAWFLRAHAGGAWAERYVDLLVSTASGHRFSFARSPLATPLGRAEVAYHLRELRRAPAFGNYLVGD